MLQSLRKGLTLVLVLISSFIFGQQIDKTVTQNFKQYQKQAAFQENKGQIVDQNGNLSTDIQYIYNAPGLKVQFKANSWSYELYQLDLIEEQLSEATLQPEILEGFENHPQPKNYNYVAHRVDVVLPNANQNIRIQAELPLSNTENFYKEYTQEEGVTNVKSYQKLTYKNVWNNIDIEWVAEGSELKYNIILHPGANPKDIQMAYQGANALQLKNGKLETIVSFALAGGVEKNNLTESIPAVFGANGANFTLKNKTIGFELVGWNKTKTTVIDPQIIWGTYYGGSSADHGNGIATDGSGNVYVIGNTISSSSISTTGTHQTSFGGTRDAYIVKFNSSGVRQWGTYYGGTADDRGIGIATDGSGNVYLTGNTTSTSGISTTGAFQTSNAGSYDAFIIKFDGSGVRQWGTYYGGTGNDYGRVITIDNTGNVYVTGNTTSTSGISTTGAHQTSYGGSIDAFIVKLNSSGVRQWGSYYGGTSGDYGHGIATDGSGNILLTGYSQSISGISTTGAHQTTNGGGWDAFVVEFNSSGVRQWGTYYGGTGNDYGSGVAVDGSGNVLITGTAISTAGFSTTGAHQTSIGGNQDAFIAKFNSSGVRQWGTYFGGSSADNGNGIATDGFGNMYVTGNTASTSGISTSGAHQTSIGGNADAFIVKFNSSGVRQWGSYFGGTLEDRGDGIAVDGIGNVVVTGYTVSTSGISSTGAFQTSYGGGTHDAFVAKFQSGNSIDDIKTVSIIQPTDTLFAQNDSFQPQVSILNQGTSNITNFYYKFMVQGANNTIDSVLVDTLKPNIPRTINLGKYFLLSENGISSLKVFPAYADDTASNDTLIFSFNVNTVALTNILKYWRTYVGGTGADEGYSIATDAANNVYITGETQSSTGIATTGAHQSSIGGSSDAFIIKFNSAGVRQWGTYYGGADSDVGQSIAIDGSGNVIITGYTESTSGIATSGAHQTSFGGGFNDAFVVKFDSLGVRQWGTYYGGSGSDYGRSIAIDGSGNVVITGYTESTSGIASTGAHQTSFGGGFDDAFVVKFNSSGVRQWGTYYGGTNNDYGQGITVDGSGNVVVTGSARSSSGISTTGAHQTSFGGGFFDGFVVKFDSFGVRQWGTYYGGTSDDVGQGIAIDGTGNILVTGYASSTSGISTSGAHQTSTGGNQDAFIAKFNSSGVRQWGTYYGGTSSDAGQSIVVDGSGNIIVTGYTFSSSGISTAGAFQTSIGGSIDAFIVKFNSSGVRQWGTYYGGTNDDSGNGIAIESSGDFLVTGQTRSTSGISSTGAFQTSFGGGSRDVFIAKFYSALIPLPVELISFEAIPINDDVFLNWSTSWEKNNESFDIEMATSDYNFNKIGNIRGNGTTNEMSNYSFKHENAKQLNESVLFYRLKQMDFDGGFEYSDIKSVRFNHNNQVQHTLKYIYYQNGYPLYHLNSNKEEVYYFKILNVNGQELYNFNQNAGIGENIIKLPEISIKGIYFLEVTNSNGLIKLEKVIY